MGIQTCKFLANTASKKAPVSLAQQYRKSLRPWAECKTWLQGWSRLNDAVSIVRSQELIISKVLDPHRVHHFHIINVSQHKQIGELNRVWLSVHPLLIVNRERQRFLKRFQTYCSVIEIPFWNCFEGWGGILLVSKYGFFRECFFILDYLILLST